MLKLLFYLSVAALSLGQFAAIVKQGEANFYLFDLVVSLFAVYGIIFFLGSTRSLKLPKNLVLFFVFFLVGFLSLLSVYYKYSFHQLLVSGLYLVRFFMYLSSGVVLYNMVLQNLISKNSVYKAFLLSGLFLSLAGFIQLKLLSDFEILNPALGWDPHKNRLASTFFDPNFTGAYLALCLAVLLENFSYLKKLPKGLSSKFYSLYFAVLLIALFMTFSRSAWALFAIIVLIYGLFRFRLWLFLSLVIAFLAYYAVPRVQTRIAGITDPADSASFRVISWENTWEISKRNLVLGVGFNTFRYVQKEYGFLDPDNFYIHSGGGSDSSLMFVLVTTGIIGLSVFLFALASVFLRALASRDGPNVLILAVLSGVMVESLFINSLFYPQILFFIVSLFVI